MKIFEANNGWDCKVNFVDENNVFVGYDTRESCCENADWFITDFESITIEESKEGLDLEPYTFDTGYFMQVDNTDEFDEGGLVRFRLVAASLPNLYLHLYNHQNGYYGHGFNSKIGDDAWKEGTI